MEDWKGAGPFTAKIVDLETAGRRAAEARRAGRTVVLTNGCYDLMHAGHVHSLSQARAQGDFLVVGLNSDRSVRRLKGPERPLNNQRDRAVVLAAMEMVDLVVIFDDDTACRLIETIRPHVYVKGADYNEQTLPEAPTARALGCRLHFVPLLPGTSTTSLLERLRNTDPADL